MTRCTVLRTVSSSSPVPLWWVATPSIAPAPHRIFEPWPMRSSSGSVSPPSAIPGHPRPARGEVGPDELQDRGASVPGHRRWLVALFVALAPKQSAQPTHRSLLDLDGTIV